MKRYAVIATIAVAVLIVATLAVLYFRTASALRVADAQAESIAAELLMAQGDSSALSAQATKTAGALSTANADLVEAEARNKTLTDDLRVAVSEHDLMLAKYLDEQCPNNSTMDFDYTSNATISDGLSAWVGDRSGSVTNTAWEVIWNNSRTSIHKVWAQYLEVFIVTFEDPDMDATDSIYYIAGHCYLDR